MGKDSPPRNKHRTKNPVLNTRASTKVIWCSKHFSRRRILFMQKNKIYENLNRKEHKYIVRNNTTLEERGLCQSRWSVLSRCLCTPHILALRGKKLTFHWIRIHAKLYQYATEWCLSSLSTLLLCYACVNQFGRGKQTRSLLRQP